MILVNDEQPAGHQHSNASFGRWHLTAAKLARLVTPILLAIGFSCPAMSEDAVKLPLSISLSAIMPYTDGIVAADEGFFAKEGFDLTRKMLSNSDILRTALASGQVEVGPVSIDTLIRAHVTGFDWQLLYQTDIYDSRFADAELVSRPDLTITSAKDLEGRTVAVSQGAISEAGLRGWMADNGADFSKVHVLDVPFAQIIGALQSKRIDAAHIVEPFMTVALDDGSAKFVAKHLDAISKRFLISGFIAKASWISANPEKAKRFVAAMNASTQYVLDHPADVLPILAKETRIDEALLRRFFPQHYVIATTIRPEEIQSVIDFMAKQQQIPSGFDFHEIVSAYTPIAQ